MAFYRINHPATGRVVNLYISSSTGSVPHGTPLSLYPWQNNSDQKFQLEYYNNGDYVIFRLQRDLSQVINRNATLAETERRENSGCIACSRKCAKSCPNCRCVGSNDKKSAE